MKKKPRVRTVVPRRPVLPPAQVPDSKRRISERGPSPMGLPPTDLSLPSWRVTRGTGSIHHTHS